MKNKSEDLRNHLFECIEALKDPDAPMDIPRAKAVADVAQVLINLAKIEHEHAEMFGCEPASDFIGHRDRDAPKLNGQQRRLTAQ